MTATDNLGIPTKSAHADVAAAFLNFVQTDRRRGRTRSPSEVSSRPVRLMRRAGGTGGVGGRRHGQPFQPIC